MFVIRFLDITPKSHNFHAFTLAYLAHAQTNFPAAQSPTIPPTEDRGLWQRDCVLCTNQGNVKQITHFFKSNPEEFR